MKETYFDCTMNVTLKSGGFVSVTVREQENKLADEWIEAVMNDDDYFYYEVPDGGIFIVVADVAMVTFTYAETDYKDYF